MKTLANCNFKEFLVQSNKVRKAISEYLTDTQLMEIRKHLPEIPKNAKPEEKAKLLKEQGRKNISDMLDCMMEDNIDATLKVCALLCFMEDEKEVEQLDPFDVIEVILNERVLNFFTRLAKSGLFDMGNM